MNLDLENQILAILDRWGVPRHTFDVAFPRWGEITVRAGGQTVKILSTGEIHFRNKHLCSVPESAVPHLVAGIVLALHKDLGTYSTDNHSPEYYE
jgi:hypothetical protein